MMRKKRYVIYIATYLCILALGIVIGRSSMGSQGNGFCPKLLINGDVETPFAISMAEKESQKDLPSVNFSFEGKRYSGFELQDLLQRSSVYTEDSVIYFIAEDGLMSAIDMQDIKDNYIAFTEKGWEAMNPSHPISSNVKEMASIVIAANDQTKENVPGIPVEYMDGSQSKITLGQVLTAGYDVGRTKEGTSAKEGRAATVYTSNRDTTISKILGIAEEVPLKVLAGERAYVDQAALKVQVEDESLLLVMSKGGTTIHHPDKIVLINEEEK